VSVVGDELQDIYNRHGILYPQLVVDEARPEGHPLHGRFEWDDAVAGEHHRRHQARQMIRSVRVVYRPATDKEQARSVRAYHAIPGDGGSMAYRPAEEVGRDPVAAALLLSQMSRDWVALKRRYGHMAEFVAMVQKDLGDGEAA